MNHANNKTVLHITNGDSTVALLRQAGITGTYLPWRDVLHEGPVPAGLSLAELSAVRAGYIAQQGWGDLNAIKADFKARDDTLKRFASYQKVLLWFEHDLYDQLQILQILDFFHGHSAANPPLSMICVDRYLGMLTPDEISALTPAEQPVTAAQLELAHRAWCAFRADTPRPWRALLDKDTSALPFLAGAVVRLLEEYPGRFNGLSRTAQQALTIIAAGEQRPGRIFAAYQTTEERRFLGDSSFWAVMNDLLSATPPLLALSEGAALTLPPHPEQLVTLTPSGQQVLAGTRYYGADATKPDRWIGGVRLSTDHCWNWDPDACQIKPRVASMPEER